MKFILCITFIVISFNAWCWDSAPQSYSIGTRWASEAVSVGAAAGFTFVDDGSSEIRYSLTPPTEGSSEGVGFVTPAWNTLDGKSVFRAKVEDDGNGKKVLKFNFGGVTRNDKNGIVKGTFYMWYGTQSMATINWSYYYAPFPVITPPAGVIDLGVCHKSEKAKVLSKEFSIGIDVFGYLNSAVYNISRTFKQSTAPDGAYFTDLNGLKISIGSVDVIRSAIPEPHVQYTDNMIALIECDKINVGKVSWNLNLTYTVE